MTGGNFLVAETGLVCSVENEGNQRQSVTTPRVLVSLVGIEKIVPRMIDLAVMLKLLPAAPPASRSPSTPTSSAARAARRKRRPGRIPPRPDRQRPNRNPRQRIPRNAALHPLRRLPERLPDLSQDRRPRLRQRLPRPDRRPDHAALPGPGNSRISRKPPACAARATKPARSRSTSPSI